MDNKDKSDNKFDPTIKLKDEILENERVYVKGYCYRCRYATYSSACKGCRYGSNFVDR